MNEQRDNPMLLAQNLRTMLADIIAGHDTPEGIAGSIAVAQLMSNELRKLR